MGLIILTNLTLYPLTILWTLIAIAGSWLFIFIIKSLTNLTLSQIVRFSIWFYGRVWLLLSYPFLRFKRLGFDSLDLKEPVLFVANHQSFFDTFLMGGLPVYDVTFSVRSWPYRMFWFRPFMRLAGYIDVEENDFVDTAKKARKILDSGSHLLFYPEGHRSRDGKLSRFRAGAFKVAVETKTPLVPLVIKGSRGFLPPGRFYLKPSRVTLTALAPIDTTNYEGELGHRKLLNHVQAQIEAELNEREGSK
jgi:1-acyl-sn-glycerol-3-phosphate acyltransferase